MNKFVVFSFFILCISIVFGIYEEEIGLKDWSIRGIGQLENGLYFSNDNTVLVQTKVLHRSGSGGADSSPTATVPSYAISLLDAENGNSKWRQLLPNQEQSFQSMTASNDNSCIYWNRKNGDLISVYDTSLANDDQCYSADITSTVSTTQPTFRVFCKNNILILKKDENNLINLVSSIENTDTLYSFDSTKVYTINKDSIKMMQVGESALKEIQSFKITENTQPSLNINSKYLIVTTNKESSVLNIIYNSKLYSVTLESIESSLSTKKISSISSINDFKWLVSLVGGSSLSVEFNKDTNKVELVKYYENTISTENNVNNYHHIIISSTSDEEKYSLSSDQVKAIKLPSISKKENGNVVSVFSFESKSGTPLVLVSMDDWSINMFELLDQNTKVSKLWTREESLSFILTSEIIDYPLPDISKLAQLQYEFNETDGFLAHFSKRISTQISSLFGLSKDSNSAQEELLKANNDQSIKKVIIASTLSGKVFGLNSNRGQVLWSIYYQSFLKESMTMKIYVTKKAIYYPPEVAIIYQIKDTPKSVISFINPLEGKENTSIIVNSKMLHSNVISQWMDPITHRQMMYWVVNYPVDHPSPMVSLHPWNEKIRKSWGQLKQSHFFLVNKEQNEIKGYGIESLANGKHGNMKSIPTWNLHFGKNNQILQVSSFNPHETIQSPAIILGNRDLLPKYVNRNLISVATLDPTTSTLNVHLVDSVTGEIIKSFKHQHSSPKVSLVQTENSVVYSHYDILTQTQLISTIDIFEKNIDWNTETFSSYNSTFDATSGADSQLLIKHKTYVFPYPPIKTLSLSITTKGITSKNIIVGMENGQILPIDKKYISARRPYPNEVTPNDAEEQLIPYKPLLQFPPWFFTTYNTAVTGLVGIESTGTDLESTSLLFSFGEPDIFCVLISPSLPYDILSDQFNHLALIITSITLFILAILAKNYKYSLILSKKWK
ncbi:hypothetical protein DICPUDRAFT_34933 [Dictyostelium purpureum]|uniref:ER membrane protein complex subunit 1 n=1 Tax=Dictyostelium purpureum TaxID=5786 RepID=F0ZNI9_DICPU|nr:uncharacterized protein DICPUDRAFT_34933 [Dictyostelium purpureum]EGC34483.1 hypothetical protein DICPUDRAFT_34933 [Dictyostelium purpureum]|eukprot:XP_003288972.1 hypothetical protein DICPUDRAFT_34933 [Dictyostelium purpureum]